MAKKLRDVLRALPVKRQIKIAARTAKLATLRALRIAASQTQINMAKISP
jgi:hypothetical protein